MGWSLRCICQFSRSPVLLPVNVLHSSSAFMNADSRSLTWYLISRTAVITFLLGGASFFYLNGAWQYTYILPLFSLIAISYVEALLSALLLRVVKNDLFAQVQVGWDLLFVTALILLSGGVESVFSFAYILVIVSASFLLSRRLTVLAAAASAVIFGGLIDLQFFNYLNYLNLYRSVPDSTFFSTVFVHVVAFFTTAVLSGTLAERWRLSEEKLQRKTIDYVELEKLNRTILSHINSGLMLVNTDKKIRSFNKAASDITGLTLEEVYDRKIHDIFPFFLLDLPPHEMMSMRPEAEFIKQNGDKIIVGYATTVARDSHGEPFGTLINFQNLTKIKRIEADLQQADRLAAVGRLAAALAHEIRNPLASISGSVQMLLENSQASDEDQYLLEIVVREADRLNALLSDFLSFARPRAIEREFTDVSQMITDLTLLLGSDVRFCHVKINNFISETTILHIDSQQIHQALWGLAVNSVEAMNGHGQLDFYINKQGIAEIVVEDDGPGVPDELKQRIFEPFFSTKDKGTGLGLASVYTVMEAHGGSVRVDRSSLGGARFILRFSEECYAKRPSPTSLQ